MTKLIHRRRALLQIGAVGCTTLFAPSAQATPQPGEIQYFYDARGRVIRVYYYDYTTPTPNVAGSIVYAYDDAGNRTQVARSGTLPSNLVWTQTIAITGTGPVNLYSLATAAGYASDKDANVTFTLASGVTITGNGGSGLGDPGEPGIDIGAWPINQVFIQLALQITGTVRGGGGSGGEGNSGPGAAGGNAIYCRAPISITVNSGGVVQSGGGGGGGGLKSPPPLERFGGGGGGGGRPNGGGGPGGEGNNTDGHAGNNGTTSGGGTGGTGGGSGATTGGTGGSYATAGNNGASGGGLGGAAGYAIRKNGYTVSVTNNGTITGTIG